MNEVLPDVAYERLAIVNIVLVGLPGSRDWVLIDVGLPGTAGFIRKAARNRFGHEEPPLAIVMTHGHFDHVGALETLVDLWRVPVFAHRLELPYLSGAAAYPPPDPSVGGLMARLSPLYPRDPVDVTGYLQPLSEDGSIAPLPGWRWIHTPGHSPGHVSLWREADRTLIAGDAVITTAQENAYGALTQRTELHGPPQYFTVDWEQSRISAERLAALQPETLVTGHGRPLAGPAMRQALGRLAADFDRVAVPSQGKYVGAPLRAEDGTVYCQPKEKGRAGRR